MLRSSVLGMMFLLAPVACLVAQQPLQAPDPYSGRIDGHVYYNDYFGLRYHLPGDVRAPEESHVSGKKEDLAEMRAAWKKELRDSSRLMSATSSHWEYPELPSNILNPVGPIPVNVVTDQIVEIFALPEGAMSPAAAIRLAGNGWDAVSSPAEIMIAEQKFLRADFGLGLADKNPNHRRYLSVFVTVRNGYVLRFVLAANEKRAYNKLLKSMGSLRFQ